jgi:hypothetical protein
VALLLVAANHSPKGQDLEEASTNLDGSKFPLVLQAVSKLVESGFGEEQVRGMVEFVKATPIGESRRREFSITYKGQSAPLRIEFKRDDEDALDIWFFTAPALAKVIQQRMVEIAEQ